MLETLKRTGAVTGRVLQQLKHDKRLLVLSTVFPLIVVYFIKVIFDVLASPGFNISRYVVPYAGFLVHFITFVLTAIVLVRERTAGTLTRMFVSGYTHVEIIGGYMLAYSLLGTIQSLGVIIEINLLFDLGFETSRLASIYLVMWMLAVISMALGILVSNFARNEGQVFPFIPLVVLSVILSGIIAPVEQLPDWVQFTSYLTPLFYANEILQNLIAGGVLSDDWTSLVSLPIYGIAVFILARLTLREMD
ncbi:MAG: ABC transporter permease [Chloroflexi bacterium]|nr:ABC transporter permease [Chloroflexota bacterium]